MTRSATAVLVLMMTLTSAALAQGDSRMQPGGSGSLFSGTPEEQKACSPDATKFCLDAMPDNMRVLACLQQHREKLRKVCLQVLEVHGQ